VNFTAAKDGLEQRRVADFFERRFAETAIRSCLLIILWLILTFTYRSVSSHGSRFMVRRIALSPRTHPRF